MKPLPDQAKMTPDQIVTAMRNATSIRSTTGANRATQMTVSFEGRNPAATAKVLDAYLTFILAEDAQYRADRAGQTQAFFQQEVDRLSAALSQQSARIVEFKNKNSDALPDGMEYRRSLQLNLQNRVTQIDRDTAALNEQKQRLTQVFETTGRTGSGTDRSPEQQYIDQLKRQLVELEAIYAPASPKVSTLRNRITQLEFNLASSKGNVTDTTDPAKAMFDLQISEIDSKIASMAQDRKDAETQIGLVQDQMTRTASNAIALDSLQRDYSNIQQQYNRATDNLARASTGERIETLSRGQRISVVDRASVPSVPVKPQRTKIAGMGILIGLAAGAALIAALDLLSGTIKRSKDLVDGMGIVPMVTIPLMRTDAEVRQIWIQRLAMTVVILGVVPLLAWLMHRYYMPFDVIASKVAARIGIKL